MPDALTDLADRIRAAAAHGQALRLRGGGTKDFLAHGDPAALAGEVLDTRGHSGIVAYEPSELVVTARAGTRLAELEAALAERGQCLPFEPPQLRIGSGAEGGATGTTVGGMVAAGLAGPARMASGGVRDYVLGLHLIDGRGQLLEFGGQVMKNVAGYDVSRAMVGAWGTLGLISQVSLKVLPVAPAEATLRFAMDEAQAIRQVNAWAAQPLPLNASSWVVDGGQPVLYLRLRGAAAAVQAACVRLARETGGQRVDSPQTQADWAAARDLRLPWFAEGLARGQSLWRLSVPPTTAPLGLGESMIEWFGAQRWLWAAPGDAARAQALRAAARAAGGHATLFIAQQQDFTRGTGRFDEVPAENQAIQRRLKAAIDPAGVFNPGRLCAAF